MTASEAHGLFAQVAGVEPAPWKEPESASWTPLRSSLRAVDDPSHSARQQRTQREARDETLRQQEKEGYDAGYRDGTLAAQQQMQQTVAAYRSDIARLAAARQHWLQQSREALVRLSLHVAGQVILTDVQARQPFVERMVQHGLTLLHDADKISIKLPAGELAPLLARQPQLLQLPQVQLSEDPTLVLGGALLQAELGTVDATVEHRLAEMSSQLHASLDAQLPPDRPAGSR